MTAEGATQTPIDALTRERLGRLRAEWQLAALQADVRREAFERAVADAVRGAPPGHVGEVSLDLDAGVLVAARP